MAHSLSKLKNAEGMVLLEFLLAVPLVSCLFLTLGIMTVWGGREYIKILADAELQQEIQIAFQRIVTDALEAKYIRASGKESGITIIKRVNPTRTGYKSEETGVNYWLNTIQGTKKLVKEDARAPMTGNHALASVNITEFSCTMIKPKLYYLKLTGRSGVTGHEYGLSTAIYIP